ncbi:N-acetyltransferase family protein [Chryseobacterium indologenes]|uniref:N-acetyltransferase n=3 Tax=Chryseobacterium TaxID=59732 RepID=A0A3G6RSM1_CHRLC|nr:MULTISPECIES: GNAT family N-acetyltransferase [Bacteroidota]AZA84566.1 N-acetyltransferase [Chryseobacterium lactis]AZB04954.1 N-acetyltransferase [Chryseobacterium lactis]KMQ64430.1 phosphinothricin acetyltransferase [Chryseobacterium angstadtii]MBF6643625.1 N-acetyltransferase [Chryseobacterium indologenes]PNW14685.1 N-acetyltransferase [Chryseobacterium lactis]
MDIISFGKEQFREIAEIYRQGLETGNATFETSVPNWEDWDKSKLEHSRFAAVIDNIIVGWAALSAVSDRCVYGGVAEVSIYISNDHKGKGIGKALMTKLITESEIHGIWTLQSGMFPENEAPIALHKSTGFRIIGHREKIGKLGDTWRDTVIMERRSKTIGLN